MYRPRYRPRQRRWRLRTSTPVLIFAILFHRASAQYLPSRELAERGDSQSSTSTSLYITSHDDFCIFGPPDPFDYIATSGLNVVSWCSQAGHSTRLIPDGTLHGVTYVKTKDYVQVSGYGDFTKINIAPDDFGGQLDSSSHTPQGAQVYVSDDNKAASSWVTLISADVFCLRACTGDASFCPTTYDQMGCWFLTGDSVGVDGTWQDCESDEGNPPGVINGKTYTQGASPTPSPTAPALTGCSAGSSVSNGQPPPPLYPWNGSGGGSAATSTGGTGAQANNNGNGAAGGDSTTWLPVSTCTPCASSAQVAAATSGSVGTTQQVGVTQMNGMAAVATTGSTTTSAAAGNDLLDKRDGATTTSNGQCCFTSWTPSIIAGGGAATTAVTSGSKTSAGGASATSAKAASTTSGVTLVPGASTAKTNTTAGSSGTASAHISAGVPLTSGNSTGNGTSDNSTGFSLRGESVGLSGMGKLLGSCLLSIGLASALGGWTLAG